MIAKSALIVGMSLAYSFAVQAAPFGHPSVPEMIQASNVVSVGRVLDVSSQAGPGHRRLTIEVEFPIKGASSRGERLDVGLQDSPQGVFYGTAPYSTPSLVGLTGVVFIPRGRDGQDSLSGNMAASMVLLRRSEIKPADGHNAPEYEVAGLIASGFEESVPAAAEIFARSLGSNRPVLVKPTGRFGEELVSTSSLVPATEIGRADLFYSKLYALEGSFGPQDVAAVMRRLHFESANSIGQIWTLAFLYQIKALQDESEFEKFVMSPAYGYPQLYHAIAQAVVERFRNTPPQTATDTVALTNFARSPIPDVRRAAIYALASTHRREFIPALTGALDDHSAPVRQQALYGLCAFLPDIDDQRCIQLGTPGRRAELLKAVQGVRVRIPK